MRPNSTPARFTLLEQLLLRATRRPATVLTVTAAPAVGAESGSEFRLKLFIRNVSKLEHQSTLHMLAFLCGSPGPLGLDMLLQHHDLGLLLCVSPESKLSIRQFAAMQGWSSPLIHDLLTCIALCTVSELPGERQAEALAQRVEASTSWLLLPRILARYREAVLPLSWHSCDSKHQSEVRGLAESVYNHESLDSDRSGGDTRCTPAPA